MGLLSGLLLLPVTAPVGGSLWVARQLAVAVERERNDPAALRAALNHAEDLLIAGELSEEDYETIEAQILGRLGSGA
jgi:hypothetical protein